MNSIAIEPEKAREPTQPNIGFKGIAVVAKPAVFQSPFWL
jgi:hypothetical protein